MKNINNYIIEKLHINKETKLSSDDLSSEIINRDDKITKDFRNLYKLISKECGSDHECLYSLCSMSDFADNYREFYYEFNPDKWAIFLRDIVNYDIISLRNDGTIDIKNSNHKEIAKIVNSYNVPDIGKKVYQSFR